MNEKYCFEVGPEGQKSLEVLDYCFNETTKPFLIASGLSESTAVLEIGCGSGVMSIWIAQQLEDKHSIIAIDNNSNQIAAAKKRAKEAGVTNIQFELLSAYDLEKLNQQFDLVYCRFTLHHLSEPDKVIKSVYQILKPGGIFVCEEGMVNAAFSYPESGAFCSPNAAYVEGERDPNIGKKLFNKFYNTGFKNLTAKLIQPVLMTQDEKILLLPGLIESKQSYLEQGHSENEWENLYQEMIKLIDRKDQMVGFYQSCQVSGVK